MVCWDAEKGTCTRPSCKWCAGAADPPKGKGKGKGKSSKGGYSGGGGGGDLFSKFMEFMMQGGGGGKGGGKGYGQQEWTMQGKYKLDESGGVLGQYVGTIKSFSFKGGYGFIECPEITAMGYQDVFLHGDMKKAYKPGQKVKFTCFLTGGGQPQAKDLQSGLK
eukprot:TRINITY_DN868_c0_g3_i1.p2 TRINITY_DN868_c0_g3~~TRINITY_DN868_c0_g3_i1.p2  ORF type:complete len:163 (-),score=74.22 TRINITY_DN868_c0_g3_i1:157-645(-)